MNMRRTLLVHLRFVLVAEPGAKSAGQFHVIFKKTWRHADDADGEVSQVWCY